MCGGESHCTGELWYLCVLQMEGRVLHDSDASSFWLDHGDVLVLDGECHDEFLHCTDSSLEQERINVTFRWTRRLLSFLMDRSRVLFANVCIVLIRFCCGVGGEGAFWGFWVLPGVLWMWSKSLASVFLM